MMQAELTYLVSFGDQEGKNFKVYEDALKAPSLVAYFNELLESKQNATAATDEKWMELGTLEPKQLDNIVKTEDMWLIAFMGASAIEEAGWIVNTGLSKLC